MAYKPSPELNSLMDKLLGTEKKMFFENVGRQLPHIIRFNLLKGPGEALKGLLLQQGYRFELLPGFQNIYRLLYQPYPIGKTLSHFLGHIYVQDLASMLPPIVLNPRAGDCVLDMSAAPGSKTTQMAGMMENRGVLVANDIVQKRLRALIYNLQRLGIVNAAVLKNYGESFGNNYFETFDKILLDPACSGLGTLHKSPEVLSWWTGNHCRRLASSQKKLLSSAVRALKPGGEMVYSTCTLTPDENEEIIDFALSEFPVELEKIEIPSLTTRPGLREFDGKSFHSTLSLTRRLYPFENETEGFFIAKLRKTGEMTNRTFRGNRQPVKMNFVSHATSPVKKYLDFFSFHFDIERKYFSKFSYYIGKTITAVSRELADFQFKSHPVKTGLTIGKPLTQIGKLTTDGVTLLGDLAKQNVLEIESLSELEKFVNREGSHLETTGRNQQIIKYGGLPIGYGLAEEGIVKSQFPRAAWPFKLKPESE